MTAFTESYDILKEAETKAQSVLSRYRRVVVKCNKLEEGGIEKMKGERLLSGIGDKTHDERETENLDVFYGSEE